MFKDEKNSKIQCLKETIDHLNKALEACNRALEKAAAEAAACDEHSHRRPLN